MRCKVGAAGQNPANRFEVLSDITLSLGDKVSLDSLAFRAGSPAHHGAAAVTTHHARHRRALRCEANTPLMPQLDIQRGSSDLPAVARSTTPVWISLCHQTIPDVLAGVTCAARCSRRSTFLLRAVVAAVADIVFDPGGPGSLGTVQNRQTGNDCSAGRRHSAQQLGARVGLEDVSLESTCPTRLRCCWQISFAAHLCELWHQSGGRSTR